MRSRIFGGSWVGFGVSEGRGWGEWANATRWGV
jgi:hypothetical protein